MHLMFRNLLPAFIQYSHDPATYPKDGKVPVPFFEDVTCSNGFLETISYISISPSWLKLPL